MFFSFFLRAKHQPQSDATSGPHPPESQWQEDLAGSWGQRTRIPSARLGCRGITSAAPEMEINKVQAAGHAGRTPETERLYLSVMT